MKKKAFNIVMYLFLPFILFTTGYQVFATSDMNNICVLGVPKDSNDILFFLDSVCADIGDTVSINMKVKSFKNIEYIIGKVSFNPYKLKFVDFVSNKDYTILYSNPNNSILSIFGDGKEKSLEDNTILFTLHFVVLGEIGDTIDVFPSHFNVVQNESDVFPDCKKGIVCVNKPTNLLVTTKYCSTANESTEASLSFKAFGGTAPYKYSIQQEGDTTKIQTGFGLKENEEENVDRVYSNNTYLIEIVDSELDTFSEIVFINPNDEIKFKDVFVKNDCFNKGNGELIVSLNKNSSDPYKIEWSNLRYDTDSIDYLNKGNYGVTVTDNASGCQIDTSVYLDSEKIWIDSIWSKSATCNGVCDGVAFVGAKQTGNGLLSYKWNNVEDSSFVDDLCPGKYKVEVVSESKCKAEITISIAKANEIEVTVDSIVDIFSSTDIGAIYISFDTTNKVFSWNGPDDYYSSSVNIGNLDKGGCYTISIKDTVTQCSIDKTFCITNRTGVFSIENGIGLEVYPNPAKESVVIDFSRLGDNGYIVTIMDVSGRVLIKNNKPLIDDKMDLDVSNLSNGIYIVAINVKGRNRLYKKFVINR